MPHRPVAAVLRASLVCTLVLAGTLPAAAAAAPRIVNIYNFIRNSDSRLRDSEPLLLEATRKEMELTKQYDLPATWALQYDALINPLYQKLLKEELRAGDEVAAWWEIPRPLIEKAGLKWRGRHDWDWAANVGFSPGYTPDERRKLVDVYMADFRAIFGRYPRTVGSWFIDEVTLAHMAARYGIVASCNCKDQIGTDGYTLWGGYWNQAYYPSRLNSYMPAQTKAGQLDVPVFRMLGSDPIYQHGTTPGLVSLEPVYAKGGGGGMPKWVDWFFDSFAKQPSLAFAYTQAGQENSFTWAAIQDGLTYQIPLIARLAKAGTLRVETLEQSGRWFRQQYPVTPPTAVVALDDWKDEGRRTVWYNSRFYRLNVLWEKDSFFIRDIHCFDESVVSPTHTTALQASTLAYETLPVVDWAQWSQAGTPRAGLWPVSVADGGATQALVADGAPTVKEVNATDLAITQPLRGGGSFSLVCSEASLACAATDGDGHPMTWAWDLIGGPRLAATVTDVSANAVSFSAHGARYQLRLAAGQAKAIAAGHLRLTADTQGKLVLRLQARE